MLKNIYSPLSGAIAQERALEVISNNLANVNTVGFKGDSVTFTLLESEPYMNYPMPIPPANYKIDLDQISPLRGNDMTYVGVAGLTRDSSQGPAIATHNPLDLMIEGKGHFAVQTDEGLRYTRAGNFSMNPDGALVTSAGHPVLGEKGVVYLRSSQFEINNSGEIYQDGKLLDRLKLYDFADHSALERVGKNYLLSDGNKADIIEIPTPSIRQGFLEGSNVNAIKNLTSMIIAHRSYEAYQKAIKNHDQIMEKSSNVVGALRA